MTIFCQPVNYCPPQHKYNGPRNSKKAYSWLFLSMRAVLQWHATSMEEEVINRQKQVMEIFNASQSVNKQDSFLGSTRRASELFVGNQRGRPQTRNVSGVSVELLSAWFLPLRHVKRSLFLLKNALYLENSSALFQNIDKV